MLLLQLPVKHIQNTNIAGLPGLIAAAVVDNDGVLPHPLQTVVGVQGIGIVKGQDAVAEIIPLTIEELDPAAIQRGKDILIRQQQGVKVLQRILPHCRKIDRLPQAV